MKLFTSTNKQIFVILCPTKSLNFLVVNQIYSWCVNSVVVYYYILNLIQCIKKINMLFQICLTNEYINLEYE